MSRVIKNRKGKSIRLEIAFNYKEIKHSKGKIINQIQEPIV